MIALYRDAVTSQLAADADADAKAAQFSGDEMTCVFCGGPVGLEGECTNECDASRDASEAQE